MIKGIWIIPQQFDHFVDFDVNCQFVIYSLLILIPISSCKKVDADIDSNYGINGNVASKVIEYLETEKISGNSKGVSIKNENIDLLKENLEFTKVQIEPLDNSVDLLIIPIKNHVISKKNLDKTSTLTLLLFTDKSGKINSGSIVYFLPRDGQKHNLLPQNTFSNMLRRKPVAADGIYKMLSLTGGWLSQIEIKDRRWASTANVQQTDKNKNSQGAKTAQCWDWYLVTTFYWSDGSTTQSSEYLGTTCDGCESGEYQSLCPPLEGGGGCRGVDCGVYSGELTVSEVRTSEPPELPDNTLPFHYNAQINYNYTMPFGVINYITSGKPFVVPPFQLFVDAAGVIASVSRSIDNAWNHTWIQIAPKTAIINWTLTRRDYYTYSARTYGPFTFPDSFTKVVLLV